MTPPSSRQPRHSWVLWPFLLRCTCAVWLLASLLPPVETQAGAMESYEIPNATFRLFVDRGESSRPGGALAPGEAESAVQTVVQAFSILFDHQSEHPRFDDAMRHRLLERVTLEPTVRNREGRASPFLVARTADPGSVRLLISAQFLKDQDYLGHPDRLAPVLAREFQWVVSKADTKPKPKLLSSPRDLKQAPIRTNKEIRAMSGEERLAVLQRLFETYLSTVDAFASLRGEPRYEPETTRLVPPDHAEATIHYYDIRIREALQQMVLDPTVMKQMPNAVRSLLNGKVWNVAFVKIDQRDWATRTRVLPADKAVSVGASGRTIQPAAILINTYRPAEAEDPFFADTKGLPMGALSVAQLATVIAKEIHHNIVEKSQAGHVAQDEMTAPE